MKNGQKKSLLFVAIALILCLISMIGASIMQTENGKVSIKQMTWESPSGYLLSGDLYIPKSATKEKTAAAIVTIEGWYNNKEMQDLYTTEFARRGYVVLALDMHGHGDSEVVPADHLYDGAVGVDGAVQMIASLPYVDKTRIGVTGHSSGGTAANMAVAIDNERQTPLIAAVLEQAGDWQDDTGGDHSGDYGSRSVGIIASEHDDFYFGTYDEDGNMLTSAKEFMTTDGAKKFLNFNESLESFQGDAEAAKYYTRDFDGKESYRVIYRPTIIHPAVTFSKECVGYAIDFFEKALGAPNPLPATDQTWMWKTVFNFIGLIGFFMFLVSFTIALTNTGYFSSLKAEGDVSPVEIKSSRGKTVFWICVILSMLFSGFSYIWAINNIYSHTTDFFTQTGPLTIGIWSALCGLFGLVLMYLSYAVYGKKNGFSAKESGLRISMEKLGKTILLSIIVIVCSFTLVFFADYFFQTDFRIWVFAIKTFTSDKVLIALRYLPFFLLFYVVNSISVNCFNYNQIGGKKWGNAILMGLINAAASIFLIAFQYITFFKAGYQPLGLTEGQRIAPIWLFTVAVILFIAPIFSRLIYKKTRNPYIAGIINAMWIVMISCSNTFTILGAATLIATTF